MSLIMAHKDGFLLHASGLIYRGFGLVFSGRSGSGKTTITGLSRTCPILSDDIVAIRRRGETFLAFGTPFGGAEEIVHGGAQMKACFSLKKGKHPLLTALASLSALKDLLKNILSLPQNGPTAGRLLETAREFTRRIECYVLTFPPDPSFWKLIEAL
ncbi:MAG: hypothetical protein HYU64_09315 [Armatimonadetes bacterium]|nr:hypothetical protein [Armatimonadota bacterium]